MKKILAELDQMATKGRHGKGAAFEKRYLKRILEIAPEYRSQFRKIWHWDDYPMLSLEIRRDRALIGYVVGLGASLFAIRIIAMIMILVAG